MPVNTIPEEPEEDESEIAAYLRYQREAMERAENEELRRHLETKRGPQPAPEPLPGPPGPRLFKPAETHAGVKRKFTSQLMEHYAPEQPPPIAPPPRATAPPRQAVPPRPPIQELPIITEYQLPESPVVMQKEAPLSPPAALLLLPPPAVPLPPSPSYYSEYVNRWLTTGRPSHVPHMRLSPHVSALDDEQEHMLQPTGRLVRLPVRLSPYVSELDDDQKKRKQPGRKDDEDE
jgi:hypothetical protein